ncbi:MAG: membrane protein insertion efficiency factor YidD [Bdellovibrionales bacterium]|jgi:putative membrane protein insertion efficiency factor|nr:membrane protein insertion efficiency factor YidD [Bdellovibrionales bacterium]
MGILSKILLLLIRGYQLTLSAFMGKQCRFYPSCSHYAMDAIRHYGALRGGWMGMRRILRCHPWNPGGYDPLPVPEDASLPEKGKFCSENRCDCATDAAQAKNTGAASSGISPPQPPTTSV